MDFFHNNFTQDFQCLYACLCGGEGNILNNKKRTQYIAQHIDLFFKIEKITGQDFKSSLMFYFTRISARQYLCIVHNFSVDEKV